LIVPAVGWLIGTILVFVSGAWSQRDKIVGAILLWLPIAVLGLSFVTGGPNGMEESTPPGDDRPVGEKVESPAILGPVELVFFVAGLPSAVYLGWRVAPERGHQSDGSGMTVPSLCGPRTI
jgi:hypothetical protein